MTNGVEERNEEERNGRKGGSERLMGGERKGEEREVMNEEWCGGGVAR